MNRISDYTPAGLAKELTKLKKSSAKLILSSDEPLSGSVIGCYLFGIDNTTGDLFYKDDSGNWQPVPSGGEGTPEFDSTVSFTTTDPNDEATIFTPDIPESTTVIYVSQVDGSQWTWDGSNYVTYRPMEWSIFGNSNINPLINFLGTTSDNPLPFRIQNNPAGKLTNSSVGFGYLSLSMESTNLQNNTALGDQSLLNTDAGENNLAIGAYSGKYNTTESNKIFINTIDRVNYNGDQTKSPIYIQEDRDIAFQNINLNGNTRVNGGLLLAYTKQTLDIGESYNVLVTDHTISIDNGVNNVNVILPDPFGLNGQVYVIKRFDDNSVGSVTISSAVGAVQSLVTNSFDASVTLTSVGYGAVQRFQSNGTNWEILT